MTEPLDGGGQNDSTYRAFNKALNQIVYYILLRKLEVWVGFPFFERKNENLKMSILICSDMFVYHKDQIWDQICS